jgi:hypothetical protein
MNMGRFLALKLIDAIERRTRQSMNYLRRIHEDSPAALWKFLWFLPLCGHGSDSEWEILSVARIAACRHEDCGACLQIVVDDALARGVDPSIVDAAARGNLTALSQRNGLVHRFAEAIAQVNPEAELLRQTLDRELPDRLMTHLALAIATARVFPTIKRAMGYSTSCSIRLEISDAQAPSFSR